MDDDECPTWWQPITKASPEPGFWLVHEDGAIRTMLRHDDGQWESPALPILVDPVGNRMVAREVRSLKPGYDLELSDCIYEPTHWMPLPDPPAAETIRERE